MADFNRRVIEAYRASRGASTGPFPGGQLLLLTTTGARSGRPHTTPLVYLEDGDRLAVFGSKGGAPTNPDWFHNLRASPEATVELGPERFPVRAQIAGPEERKRLFAQMKERAPVFAEYERRAGRTIPVILLERV